MLLYLIKLKQDAYADWYIGVTEAEGCILSWQILTNNNTIHYEAEEGTFLVGSNIIYLFNTVHYEELAPRVVHASSTLNTIHY